MGNRTFLPIRQKVLIKDKLMRLTLIRTLRLESLNKYLNIKMSLLILIKKIK